MWKTTLTCEYAYNIIVAMDTFEHDQNEILAQLEEPIRSLQDALEHGVILSDGVIAECPYDYDSMLDAHLIRFGACGHLRSIEPQGWMFRFLHHSGIEAHKEPYAIRVTKSYKNVVPHPGKNLARIEYWSQQQPGLFPNAISLLLDWDLDLDREVVLHLSKPAAAWRMGEKPVLEWRHRIAVEVAHDLAFIPADEDVEVESMFDLDDLREEQEE